MLCNLNMIIYFDELQEPPCHRLCDMKALIYNLNNMILSLTLVSNFCFDSKSFISQQLSLQIIHYQISDSKSPKSAYDILNFFRNHTHFNSINHIEESQFQLTLSPTTTISHSFPLDSQ